MMKPPNTHDKFKVLLEDLEQAAKLALELNQIPLASILYHQVAILAYATSKPSRVEPALKILKEIAQACCEIFDRHLPRGATALDDKGE